MAQVKSETSANVDSIKNNCQASIRKEEKRKREWGKKQMVIKALCKNCIYYGTTLLLIPNF